MNIHISQAVFYLSIFPSIDKGWFHFENEKIFSTITSMHGRNDNVPRNHSICFGLLYNHGRIESSIAGCSDLTNADTYSQYAIESDWLNITLVWCPMVRKANLMNLCRKWSTSTTCDVDWLRKTTHKKEENIYNICQNVFVLVFRVINMKYINLLSFFSNSEISFAI